MVVTIGEAHSEDAYYGGDHPHWLIVGQQNRDSDLVVRSNWKATQERMKDEDIEWEESRSGHWLVGWVEYLIVPPSEREFVEEIEDELSGYPILDEQLHSEMEQELLEKVMTDECKSFCLAKDYPIEPEALETLAWSSMDEDSENDPYYYGIEDWMPSWEWLEELAQRLTRGEICTKCGGQDADSGRYCGNCLNIHFGIYQFTLDSVLQQ